MAVPTTRFGRTGLQVPTVSLGTWAYGGASRVGTRDVGWSGQQDSDAIAALTAAHRAGITHWDTADVYGGGRSESLIGGMWGTVPRDAIVLASKVGWNPGEFGHAYHPEFMRRELDASLRRLRTDVIDIYYLHHCDFGEEDRYLDDALDVVRSARDAGKIRFIGLSDWDTSKLMRVISSVDPDVVQPYRNVSADSWESSGLAAYCREHDCGVAYFSPLRHGLLLGKYSQPTTFDEGDFRNNDDAFRDAELLASLIANRDALVARFGERSDQPVLGALLGAMTAGESNACVLLGQRNAGQVASASSAAQLELSPSEAGWVRALYAP